jgi:aminopeptidase N
VRAAIVHALGAQHTERALDALITALDRLDPQTEPKARRAIVAALGEFQAHEGTTQAALAERAAATLTALLERGDPSYYVFAAAARSLGATRTPGAFERLTTLVDIPSWIEIIRGGVFGGIGATGDQRAVDILASWATDLGKPMDARAAAVRGLAALAQTKRIEPSAAQTRAVDALIVALDDPWEATAAAAVGALALWGDRRAIPALQRVVSTRLDERLIRGARVTLRRLQTGDTAAEGVSQLRDDVETLRDDNRKLRARLDALEAATKYTPDAADNGANGSNGHAANGNGANGHAANDSEAAGTATANDASATKRRTKKVSADKSVD